MIDRPQPQFPLAPGETAIGKLRDECFKGIKERYRGNESIMPGSKPSDPVLNRLDQELDIIRKNDTVHIFLIAWDLVRHARHSNIFITGQGAANGSLVCYSLFLCHTCPLEHGLLSERFLGEGITQCPQIELHICRECRHELIDYLRKTHGVSCSVRNGHSMVVAGPGYILPSSPIGATLAGSTLSEQDAETMLPGLRLCSGLFHVEVISRVLTVIKRQAGTELDLEKIPLDDHETFQWISNGDPTGLGPLEGKGFRNVVQRIEPSKLDDLVAAHAIYRPGPLREGLTEQYLDRRQGLEYAKSELREVNEILANTCGLLLYQEQAMLLLNKLAGIDKNQAYPMTGKVGKKDPDAIQQCREQFLDGAAKRRVSLTVASEIWQMIEKHSITASPRCHATGLALLLYWLAYLKAHHPEEFRIGLEETGYTTS